MSRDSASARQVEAADPKACTWLTANAGSGKTRVLTDRVARLLLADAPPQNILCLTFTKAAASEMQNRLFRRLGDWAMQPDAALSEALDALGVDGLDSPDMLRKARRLFARAIETPGGLKIQTIHSFCAAILRRFPLEAELTPGFRQMEEDQTAQLRGAVLSGLAEDAPALFTSMAILEQDLTQLAGQIEKHRTGFDRPHDAATLRALLGAPAATVEAVLDTVFRDVDTSALEDAAHLLLGVDKKRAELGQWLLRFVGNGPERETFDALRKICLYAASNETMANQPTGRILTKPTHKALGPLIETVEAFQQSLSDAVDGLLALEAAEQSAVLHRFAQAYLPRMDAAKAALGWLDFDDQIRLTSALLSRPGVSDWVLYRLDGDIDHILVDEAQDTSPSQWRVIERLTQEMTSGQGVAAPGEKTLFVVGDLKQSIYSFQGADPEGFGRMQTVFDRRLTDAGAGMQRLDLEYSFRSAGPILAAVDATFDAEGTRLTTEVRHRVFRQSMPGRVDLWPAVAPSDKPEAGPWSEPVDLVAEDHHDLRLARQVASEIRRMIDTEVLWEGDEIQGYRPRQIQCGDILILVQRRGRLFHEIIAACKSQGLDIAGADRLLLSEDLAFKDLMALLSFLATPEDDLSLAAALRSPLFGWSEAALYDLAAGRGRRYLWQALRERAADFPETHARLKALRDQADFIRPYDLLERILIRDRGRARLIGRLGEEAADAIDALLTKAVDYEQLESPSLTGFLASLDGSKVEVKREAGGRGRKIRVMTVHGAKGLESPIVILPQCGPLKARNPDRLLLNSDGLPLWWSNKATAPKALNEVNTAHAEALRAERDRLLYVAMTRAEQWLIVGAAGDLNKTADTWWHQIEAGLQSRGAVAHPFGLGTGLRLESGWTDSPTPSPASAPETGAAPLPDWVAHPAPVTVSTAPARPSNLGGAKALPGEDGLSEAAALARGQSLHLLLEHLPGATDPDRLAARLLDKEPDRERLLAEALAVLNDPELAPLFGPGSLAEVEIAAPAGLLGQRGMTGVIDRLVREPGRVLAVDFKSNAVIPDSPETVPEGLLRQMGAYAAMLAPLYPGCRIDTALLWTRAPRLMRLPDTLTAAAFARALGDGAV